MSRKVQEYKMKRFVIILVLACALVAVGIAAKPLLAGAQGSSAGMCCSDGNMSCCCDKCNAALCN